MPKVLALILSTTQTGCGVHTCNPCSCPAALVKQHMEGRTEGWEVKIIFSHTELEAGQSHMQRGVLECQITSSVSTLVFSSSFLLFFNLSVEVFCLSVCSCVTGTCGGQRKMLDPGELELQMVVRCHVGLNPSLLEEQKVFLTTETCLQF